MTGQLTALVVPLLLAGVALYAAARRVDVYDGLLTGARGGLEVLLRVAPALVVLLPAVYMLRASGALDLLAGALAPLLERLGVPPETVRGVRVRPVSGSAAETSGIRPVARPHSTAAAAMAVQIIAIAMIPPPSPHLYAPLSGTCRSAGKFT